MTAAPSDAIQSVLAKSKVTILVTDSGMGGMGIFADIAARLKSDPIFSNVSLIYYNAWPEQHRGYNRLKDANERVRVFDQVLAGMKRFKPDIIMIACNTLSILYDQTIFSRRDRCTFEAMVVTVPNSTAVESTLLERCSNTISTPN